jgi:hypothetical protein
MRSRTISTPEELAQLLERPTVSWPEAAALCGVGVTAFKGAVHRGEIDLPVISVGARKVIPTSAIKRLLGAGQ